MTMEEEAPPSHRAHRDADEEALQAALLESVQPDFLAEILQAETQQSRTTTPSAPAAPSAPSAEATIVSRGDTLARVESDDDDDLSALVDNSLALVGDNAQNDVDDDSEADANVHNVLLNFPEYLLVDVLKYLDEDSIGHSLSTCKRLHHVGHTDEVFETLCRRIFPAQNPKVAVAAAANRFALRRFHTWFDMFTHRPRVRYNGFYWLRISYYKKPELNMWTEITPGTILQVIYYRYFSFQRDGSVLYGMLFKPPHEATNVLKSLGKDVYIGRYHVERDEVFVSVPTKHNVVEFRFRISPCGRGKNVMLVLEEHYSFSEPDRTGWIDNYHTAEEEFQFYRSWNL